MNKCIDCGKKLVRQDAKRCKSCAKKGILNSNYKKGKYIQNIYLCLECNRPISHMASQGLCKSCFQKGSRNLSWKGGLPHCIDCGKQLGLYAYQITKRCRRCFGLSIRGKKNPNYGKSPNWKRIKYKNTWMRSTWEVAYAKYLDKNKTKWLYEPKTFDLENTTYTPDFYLPESDTYIEIKGWMRIKSQDKIDRISQQIKIKIIDKKILKELKII
jgi:hypothetical protein